MSWLTTLIVVFYAVGYLVTWRRLAWSYYNDLSSASLTEAIAVTAFSSMAWPGFVAYWAIKSLDVDLMWLIEPRSVRRERERRERESDRILLESRKTPTQRLIDRYVKGAISFEQFDAGVDEILASQRGRSTRKL